MGKAVSKLYLLASKEYGALVGGDNGRVTFMGVEGLRQFWGELHKPLVTTGKDGARAPLEICENWKRYQFPANPVSERRNVPPQPWVEVLAVFDPTTGVWYVEDWIVANAAELERSCAAYRSLLKREGER